MTRFFLASPRDDRAGLLRWLADPGKGSFTARVTSLGTKNGGQHTIRRARGLDFQFVPQGSDQHDIQFYGRTEYDREMKRLDISPSMFILDLDKYPSQVAAANAIHSGLCGG